jgi:hypothetical protein
MVGVVHRFVYMRLWADLSYFDVGCLRNAFVGSWLFECMCLALRCIGAQTFHANSR